MNIHEYQAKAILKEFGAPVSRGVAVFKVEEAEAAAKELGGPLWVVKSQIHAGGRGKGKFKEAAAGEKGGVRLSRSIDEVKANVQQMLGNTLVTIQTGPAGKQVNRLYIEEGSDIEKEFYLSALVDRETSRVSFVVSTEGVIAAVREVGLKVPLVVRLEGTNVDLGKKIIGESKLNVIPANDLDDAAQKIVKAVKGAA